MKLGIWAAMALFLASPAGAWAQQAGAGARAADKGAPKKAPKKSTKAKEAEASESTLAARALARRTKSVLMFAVESCAREGNRCDPELPQDAERRFLEACGACAPSEKCQAERDAIRAGTARTSTDPCAP